MDDNQNGVTQDDQPAVNPNPMGTPATPMGNPQDTPVETPGIGEEHPMETPGDETPVEAPGDTPTPEMGGEEQPAAPAETSTENPA